MGVGVGEGMSVNMAESGAKVFLTCFDNVFAKCANV